MHPRFVVALPVALLATSALAAIEASSRITKVTVHPDRAEVTREAVAQVPQGAARIVIAGLPDDMEDESLRVGARGASATLGAVDVREVEAQLAPSSEAAAADADMARLQAESAKLAAEEATDQQLRSYLDSLRVAAASRSAPTPQPVPVAELQEMLTFLRSGYTNLADRDLRRQAARADLARELAAATARQAAARPSTPTVSKSVAIDVTASAPGSLTVDVSYVMSDCGWKPAYRALLDSGKRQLTLVSEAVVTQQTGEDWRDVDLTLSTTAPSDRLNPPALATKTLVVQAAIASSGARISSSDSNDIAMVVTGGFNAQYGEQSASVNDAIAVNAAMVEPELVATEYSLAYVVTGRSTVESDDAEHRVTLRSDTLPVELSYRIVPAVVSEAYVLATGKAPSDHPLLRGGVRVVSDGTYVGTYDMRERAPGEEISVPFGTDRRIRVTRVALPETGTSGAAGGRDRQDKRAYRTTIESLRDVAVTVALEDCVPVPADDRITVKVGDTTTDGSAEAADRPGVRTWTFDVPPHGKRDVNLEYTVRRPKDLVLAGM